MLLKREVLEMYRVITELQRRTLPIKFEYALGRNKSVLSRLDVVDLKFCNLLGQATPDEDYKKYDREKLELARSLARKGDDGNPIINEVGMFIIEDALVFQQRHDELKEKYKDTIKKYDEKQKQVDSTLEETIEKEPVFYKIKLSSIPSGISGIFIDALLPLIEDDSKEMEEREREREKEEKEVKRDVKTETKPS